MSKRTDKIAQARKEKLAELDKNDILITSKNKITKRFDSYIERNFKKKN